jgi:gliding motility-associated-like protein
MKKITFLFFAILFSVSSYSQFPLQDFEGATFPPTSWAVFDNGINAVSAVNWSTLPTPTATPVPFTGIKSAYMNRAGNIGAGLISEDYLTTPALNVPVNGEIKFYTRSLLSTPQASTLYLLKAKLVSAGAQNDPTGYVTIEQWDDVTNPIAVIFDVFEQKTIPYLSLPIAYRGVPIYLAFCMKYTQPATTAVGNRWLVDNFQIVQQCLAPPLASLTAAPIFATNATLGWSSVSGSTQYEIENTTQAGTFTGIATGTSTTNSFNQTGLTGSTCYKFRVRSNCGLGNFSPWVGPFNYCTGIAPPVCGGVFVDSGGISGNYASGENITTTICPTTAGQLVTVAFTSFNTESCCDRMRIYDGNTASATLLGTFQGNALPTTFTSSAANGCLTFVFTSDSSVTGSGWLANVTCAPAPTCRQPQTLSANSITTTTANLSWVSPGTATTWQILALAAGSPAPTATSTGWVVASTNPYLITGLTPGFAYEYYIRGNCGLVDGVSLWSGPFAFSTIPTCPTPTNLTSNTILSTSVNLSWINSSSATTWQVLALPCGSAAPTVTSTGWIVATTNTNFVYNGLNPSTCYDFYVRGVCSATDLSFWSTPISATTRPVPPACGGIFVDSGGISGSYANGENSTTTICPTIAGQLVTVAFTSFNTESCCDRMQIYDGNSASATLLGTFQGNTLPTTFTSSAANGCLTFVFTSDGSVTSNGWVANVTCGPAPTCSRPNTLTNSVVLSSSVTLNWVQPANPGGSIATSWQVLALPCGSAAPTATSTGWIVATTNINFVYGGLNPSTCYDFYVRATCSAIDLSTWSELTSATTRPVPPVCGGIFVDSGGISGNYSNSENSTTTICPTIAGQLVTVEFTSFNTESCCDRMQIYDGNSAAATLLGTFQGNALPTTFTSTAANGCLTFVFTSDGSVTSSGWVANVTCGPAPTCSRPNTLTNSGVLSSSVTLNWIQPNNLDGSLATTWQVLAITCGSPFPTATTSGWIVANTNTNFVYGGLNPSTCYDFYVRATCSATDISTWSTLTSATTTSVPPACGGIFVDSGGISGNYASGENITTTICPTIAGQLVTVAFTSFDTESCCDRMRIYDGDTAAATLLGTFQGNALPTTFTSSAANGCLTFVFTSDSSVTGNGWLANVTCSPAPTCSRPNTLTNSGVLSSSVILSWLQPANPDGSIATSWQVLALPCGSVTPTATSTGWIVANTNTNFTYGGLNPFTCYDFYVRATCSATDISTWSTLLSITTLVAPPVCGGNYLDPGITGNYGPNANAITLICPITTTDKVTITFSSFDTELNTDILRVYNGNSATSPLIGAFSGNSLPPSITSSAANGCLFFEFISNGTLELSGWNSTISCGPALACPNPIGLNASSVVTTTSTLSWIEPGTATSWQVLRLPCGSPLPTPTTLGWVTATSNPYIVTGLTPNCCNDYYVRSICTAGGTTSWSRAYQSIQGGSFVSWALNPSGTGLVGTFPGGTVIASLTGTGNPVTFDVPANFQDNLPVTGLNTFSTFGPTSSPPSQSLTFTFSTPVIVSQYSMADVDLGSSWNDTFNFSGVTFTTTSSTNLTTTTTGAVAITDTVANGEFGSWFNSTTPVSNFSLNYATTGGLTHAYLAYSLKVFIPCPPVINNLSVIVNSPTVCDGQLATITATPTPPGNYTYSWTVPVGAVNPGNVASFTTLIGGVYSVIVTNVGTGVTSNSTGTVTLTPLITPTFITPAPICNGAPAPILPALSINNITGTWSPLPISNTLSGVYTFTPNSGQCATTTTINITVLQNCSFGSQASAVWLDNCSQANFFNTVGSGTSIIGPVANVFSNNNLGTYIQNSNSLILRGAELKTFKTVNANVCSARFNYRVYPLASVPPAFTVLNLPFFDDCNSGTFPTGGPCSAGDQKWQRILANAGIPAPINLTAFAPGNYILEVFYDITGDATSATSCSNPTIILIDNGGANFKANFTIHSTPTYSFSNPTICNAADGTITVSGLAPSKTYSVSYQDDSILVGPTSFTSNVTGEIVLTGLNAGNYTNITTSINGCTTVSSLPIILVNPIIIPTFNSVAPICSGTVLTALPTTSLNGISGAWTPALNNLTTTTYTFNPTSGQCASTVLTTLVITVNPQPIAGTSGTRTICNNSTTAINLFSIITGEQLGGTWTRTSGTGGAFDAVAATFTPTATTTSSTFTYTLTGTPPCLNATSIATININPQPNAGLDGNASICSSSTLSINLFGLITGEQLGGNWTRTSGTGGTFSAAAGTYTPNATATTSTFTYTVFGTAPCTNDTSLATITITPFSNPTFNITPTSICSGGVVPDLPLTSSNGISGTWSTGVISNTASGTYTFTSSSVQCPGSFVFTFTVNPLPTAPTVGNIVQPTCTTLSGSASITSPLNSTTNASNLFISEVTDAETGSLTYVEIYNGTGVTKNLSNYKLKIFNNGNTTASCDLLLSGTIANNSVNVIKVSSDANVGGIVPNQSFISCGGVNIDDNIKLTTSTDVVVDNWGRSDGVTYTPNNQTGYTYRRIATATVPNVNWNPADWTSIDPEVYLNLGSYIYLNNSYTYNVDGGPYQSNTLFTGLASGNHTFTVQDTTTGCSSLGTTILINPLPLINTIALTSAIGTDSQTVCINSSISNISYNTTGATGATITGLPSGVSGSWSANVVTITGTPTTSVGSPFNYTITTTGGCSAVSISGVITVKNINTIVLTSLANTSNQTVCINQAIANITYLTTGANSVNISGLPTGVTGTWVQSTNIVTISGTPTSSTASPFTYLITLNGGCGTVSINGTITVNPNNTLTLTSLPATLNQLVCINSSITNITFTTTGATGATVSGLPSGVTGSWSSNVLTISGSPISNVGSPFNYTISLSGGCGIATTTGIISVNAKIASTFNSITVCNGTAINFPASSLEGTSGTWNPSTISNTVSGNYIFIPNTGQCANNGSLIVVITPKTIPLFTPISECQDGIITLPLTSNNGINGTWNPSTIATNTPGLFTPNFTPTTGQCAENASITVTIKPKPLYGIVGGCVGNNYTLEIVPIIENATYVWLKDGVAFTGNTSTNVVSVLGNYSCQVTSNGCTNSVTFNVNDVYCQFPKGVSPNGDNKNDNFDLTNFKVQKLEIYNRYGLKVYEQSNYTNQWYGQTNSGETLPDGTYYYVAEIGESSPRVGWVYVNKETN